MVFNYMNYIYIQHGSVRGSKVKFFNRTRERADFVKEQIHLVRTAYYPFPVMSNHNFLATVRN
jgi:hypothetical protein